MKSVPNHLRSLVNNDLYPELLPEFGDAIAKLWVADFITTGERNKLAQRIEELRQQGPRLWSTKYVVKEGS